MQFENNVGGIDRIIRGVSGIWLIAVAISALLDDRRTTAAIAAIAGAGLLRNAQSQHCGGNALLGIDTTTSESRSLE
ncbi:Protein of unknown function [Haladaptatus litoreus]|uniref:Inner membrane protein YgaP-like transmembrane domain-containing protein n=1 Tax=Haladaptatus litoreus TaxID=553468 RepID=A0A1N7B4T3_9EURY|nr:YgaP-like transmembrane domain [Haladaptatus litoreus]SIR46296.1 Protein of unknown function [Haladaptatus litoreus]